MLDTKKQRGRAIAVVAATMAAAAFALELAGEGLVRDDADVAAQELEAVFDSFESVADTQMAMATGELGLPGGASFRFVDGLHAVASQEVRGLTGVRCVRVEASAPDVDSAMRIDETVVSRRPCGS